MARVCIGRVRAAAGLRPTVPWPGNEAPDLDQRRPRTAVGARRTHVVLPGAEPPAVGGQTVTAVPVTSGTRFTSGKPKPLFQTRYGGTTPVRGYDIAKDGRFLMPHSEPVPSAVGDASRHHPELVDGPAPESPFEGTTLAHSGDRTFSSYSLIQRAEMAICLLALRLTIERVTAFAEIINGALIGSVSDTVQ